MCDAVRRAGLTAVFHGMPVEVTPPGDALLFPVGAQCGCLVPVEDAPGSGSFSFSAYLLSPYGSPAPVRSAASLVECLSGLKFWLGLSPSYERGAA